MNAVKVLLRVFLVSLVLLFSSLDSIPANAQDNIKVYIDRSEVSLNVQPVIQNGRTLIPMRSIFESLGAQVNWDGEARQVTATQNGTTIELTIGVNTAKINGQPLAIDLPAQIINARTFVPLRFVTETLGYHVYWNGQVNGIYISTKGPDLDLARQEQLTQVKTWKKTYGGNKTDQAYCIQQSPDGGYILVGKSESFPGSKPGDIYLLKLDSYGDRLWEKTYPGGSQYDPAWIQPADDGGYIILGNQYNFGDDQYGVSIIKIDAGGTVQWEKSYGSQAKGQSIIQTGDGGYVVAGQCNGITTAIAWLLKVDEYGNLLWEKSFKKGISNGFNSVVETADGSLIMAGWTLIKEGAGVKGTDQDFYVVKTDKLGNKIWEKNYGGISLDAALSVHLLSDGGYALAGLTNSYGAGYSDAMLIKVNPWGEIVWQRTYGGTGDDAARSVIETSGGDIVFAGTSELFNPGTQNKEIYLVRTDSLGNALFEKCFGSAQYDWVGSMALCFDGGYIMAGCTNYDSDFWKTSGDIYIIKTDSNGNVK